MLWILFVALASVGVLALAQLPEKLVRWAFALGLVGAVVGLVLNHLSTPGFELGWMLLVGVTLAGAIGGEAVKGALVPLALSLPLALAGDVSGNWASHTHWSTAAYVLIGFAIAWSFRALASEAGGFAQRSNRVRFVLVGASIAAGALAAWVPSKGPFAWNVLLPMVNERQVPAEIVTLAATGADAWPWLEPLTFALPTALLMLAMVLAFTLSQRTLLKRGTTIAAVISAVVALVWIGLAANMPGALGVLPEVDPSAVLASARPAWIPSDATVYLGPENSVWQVSRAALLLWCAVGLALATSLSVSQSVGSSEIGSGANMAMVGAVMLAVVGAFLAESWTQQATSTTAQPWEGVVWFASAAFVGGASMLRGQLGAWTRALAIGFTMASLVYWLATRVVA